MRKDVLNQIKLMKEDIEILNKIELARRFNGDPRTIDGYINGKNNDVRKPREVKSKIDDFKEIITDEVDNWGSNSMAVFKFMLPPSRLDLCSG